MATLNYAKRLQNLQERKYDDVLNKSIISESFSASGLPETVKYLMESMRPIEKKYNDKTVLAADRVMEHLERDLNLHFQRTYRKQGSVQTSTNIKIHSDIDLLTVIDKYFYLAPGMPVLNPYVESIPKDDISDLRSHSVKILKTKYDDVDDSHEKCISIYNKALKRKVDVVFCFWYNTEPYQSQKDEYFRGIKFSAEGPPDFPFAHIFNVNDKGDKTFDGSRKGIRLLKTLKVDSDTEYEHLKSFELTSIVHSIDNSILVYRPGQELGIAQAISGQLNILINNPEYRKNIKSPNGMENPLSSEDVLQDMHLLKQDLDLLIQDVSKELQRSLTVKNAIINY
jgi:hypothetical protein